MSNYLVKKPTPEKNEKGIYIITEKYACDLSEYNGHYSIPKFIGTLHLHFKGFQKIQSLENFINLQILYLENNCISRIEGLDKLINLKCLFLMNNFIDEIDGLNFNTNLVLLNLSHNKLKEIKNIKHLVNLQTLTLDNNLIEQVNDLEEIRGMDSLSVLGINDNLINEPVTANQVLLLDLLKSLTSLKVFYFKGNDIVRKILNYRKLLIKELTNLTYLDDKPVDECERLSIEGFWKGGLAEEKRIRNEYRIKKDFGHRIREYDKENPTESIEERKKKSIESLKNEYLFKKQALKQKKQKLLNEYQEALFKDDKISKNQITRELQSIDNQIIENEVFKCEEEEDKAGIVVKRGEHITKVKQMNKEIFEEEKEAYLNKTNIESEEIDCDSSNIFIFEDWMNDIFEFYLVNHMWNFNDAVNCFQYEYRNKVKNVNLLSERDLRIRWANIENDYLNKTNYNELYPSESNDNCKISTITKKQKQKFEEEKGKILTVVDIEQERAILEKDKNTDYEVEEQVNTSKYNDVKVIPDPYMNFEELD